MQKSKVKVVIKCSMVELYCDKLNDLLYKKYQEEQKIKHEPPKIQVIYNKETGRTELLNWVVQNISTLEEAISTYKTGIINRKTAATNFNHHSSRSHLIYTLSIHTKDPKTKNETAGKLTFVDLAGSENLKNEENKQRTKEGIEVNRSLSALRSVIASKVKKQNHTPFRDNLLTKILQDSIGGTSKTLVIVNINPSNKMLSESKNSLSWASKLKEVENLKPGASRMSDKEKEKLELEKELLAQENEELKYQLSLKNMHMNSSAFQSTQLRTPKDTHAGVFD